MVLALSLACNQKEDDDLFGKTPTERLQEKTNELRTELLSSPHGWKLTYQTDNQTYGGFTFVMKFDEQGQVAMVSDFDQSTITQQQSHYQIKVGQGILLSFVTKNHIHNLADAILGSRGKGFEGEFEFIYIGKEGEKLKFKTQRIVKDIYLEKATANDWNTITNLLGSISVLDSDSYRHFVRITNANGEIKDYKMSLNDLRYMTLRNFTNSSDQYKFGLIPTSKGLTLSPAPTFEGKTFNEFIWDANASPARYITTIDGVTAEILFSLYPKPEHVTDDYKDIEKIDNFIYINNLLKNTTLTSDSFRENLIKIDDDKEFSRLELAFGDNQECNIDLFYNFSGRTSILRIFLEYEIKDKKIYISLGKGNLASNNFPLWRAPENKAIYDKAMSVFSFFVSAGANGFYIEKQENKYTYSNVVYVLQSHSPSGYYFPVYSVFK